MVTEPVIQKKRKLGLIEDWKQSWKFASTRINVVGLLTMGAAEFLGQAWSGLPSEIKDHIPHATTIAIILFALSMVGRIIKLREPDDGNDD